MLVDDVLYTGRTIWAALQFVLSRNAAPRVQLAVLVDRGHRELPIQADYIGRILPTKTGEIVKVMLDEYDQAEKVLIVEADGTGPESAS